MRESRLAAAIPAFPPRVSVEAGYVRDDSLGERYPVNGPAEAILRRVDGQSRLGQIAEAVAKEFNTPYETAFAGTVRLARQLNGSYLLNLKNAGFATEILMVLAPVVHACGWPLAADTISHRSTLKGMLPTDQLTLFGAVWMAVRTPLLVVGTVLGIPGVLMGYGLLLASVTLSFVLAVYVHEAFHLIALQRCGYRTSDIFIVTSPGRVALGRRPGPDEVELTIGFAGPGMASLVGCLLMGSYVLFDSAWLAAAALPFLLQILTLCPWFDDNQVLTRLLSVARFRISAVSKQKGASRMVFRWAARLAASILAVYVAFVVLSFTVSVIADMAGAGSFVLRVGPVEFYRFVKEPGGFRGSLGGGSFWMAVFFGCLNLLLVRRYRQDRDSAS